MSERPLQHVDLDPEELEALRRELRERAAVGDVARWSPEPDEARQAVAKLVLTLAEFIRSLLERQAIRRLDEDTLTAEEVEALGLALMELERALNELAERFDIDPEELNLDLGPIGRLI